MVLIILGDSLNEILLAWKEDTVFGQAIFALRPCSLNNLEQLVH